MKIAVKIMIAGAAICAFATQASAYTLNGTIPVGKKATIDLQKPIPPNYSYVKLSLTLPQRTSAGITYAAGFCVGPPKDPCPLPITVPGGQQIIVIFDTAALSGYTLTLDQGTSAAVPYTVNVEYLVH